jgi:L-2-amino-thiazoline-4-carboxylic acid hydrolase
MNSIKFKSISLFFKLKSTLNHELGKDIAYQVLLKTKFLYNELDSLKPKEKGIMRFHRTILLLGLALYRAMKNELGDRNDLVGIINKILWNSTPCDMMRMQAFFVRNSKDPYNLFLRLLGPRNEHFFLCPPWEKVEVELENGVGWDQVKCPYYDFFKEEGEVALTKAYCDIDKLVAKLVPDIIELKRERTLADGDSSCDFYYYKK